LTLIIIEGLDGAGKTTFARRIVQQLTHRTNLHHLRFGPPRGVNEDPFFHFERSLYEYLDSGMPIICDRLHWSERAYGPVLRGRDRLGVPGWRHVELFLRRHDAVVVYLHQPREVLADRIRTRGDDLVSPDQLTQLEVGYQWCLRNTILPVISLRDPTDVDAETVIAIAEGYWRADTCAGPTYVGRQDPDFLVFGEARSSPVGPDRSAFVPRRSTSGYHLLNCLPERIWGRMGLCNALEEPDPRMLWEDLLKPPTIALGRLAHERLCRFQVPHGTVPHPQFIRRFHHKSLPRYGQLIERVLGTRENRLDWRGEPLVGPSLEDGTPLPTTVSNEETR